MSGSPAQVFANLVPSQGGNPNQDQLGVAQEMKTAAAVREVHVSGRAELSAVPDRARVSVHISNQKETAGEAKSSVVRRLEYIMQSIRQQGVLEENMTVMKNFTRVENAYQMEAEVCITFSDFGKMQNLCNLLVEKLDGSVLISPLQFYHTQEAVEKLRRQVCITAVGNAQRKAQEICRLVGQALGKPLLIREEELKEWECSTENQPYSSTVQQKIKNATIFASSKVFVNFEIKGKEKNKKNV
ncbi:interleukin-1 receptor-associated kinase 1-binding protein 1 [Rhinatrema bivittatum]|uniref:interleukin-1 receptor-associated kinase 1-binding protein 1 n=1 Tax=Rhinatrema bivittatum TaxID=194408 RepID=UPI00112C0D9F|nr:interleukin-1 receptor-associated kinase 1-binding protein 1 [Rhinatrema bivittatum]